MSSKEGMGYQFLDGVCKVFSIYEGKEDSVGVS